MPNLRNSRLATARPVHDKSGTSEHGEIGYELVFGGYLQIVAGLGLAVVLRVLFHAHERRVWVGL